MTFFNVYLTLFTGISFIGYWVSHYFNYYYFSYFFQSILLLIHYPLILQRLSFEQELPYLLLGIILGLLLFIISFIFTTPNPIQSLANFVTHILPCFSSEAVKLNIPIHIKTALWEELYWRVCLQGILMSVLTTHFSIALTAILFWIGHFHRFKNSIPRMLEMILFSLLLGVLFELTESFILCVTIHFIRNILIICYRTHVIRLIENRP
ncbi:MAG: hypothetical protein CL521_05870 [Actinobacteria bacterium]|nr:hypothetical protein [Actinomycetota bacterium]